MCLGWAKAHRSVLLEGVLQGQGAAVFESEASRSCPHSALTLFIKERVVKISDLSLEVNGFIHDLLCLVVLGDL